MNWQPIETGPSEREVLLFCDGKVGMGEKFAGVYWTFYEVGYDADHYCKPTHWMELPEPPK